MDFQSPVKKRKCQRHSTGTTVSLTSTAQPVVTTPM
ncbi:hypothetical protein LSH36_568g02031, partial [Paralvinella palmiformis]